MIQYCFSCGDRTLCEFYALEEIIGDGQTIFGGLITPQSLENACVLKPMLFLPTASGRLQTLDERP